MMSEAGAFNLAASMLEAKTDLTGPQARGIIRLALKKAGFTPEAVSAHQMGVLFERLVAPSLTKQGVAPEKILPLTNEIVVALEAAPAAAPAQQSATFFDRLDNARGG